MICSFLLLGQSNMAGRGFIKDVPPICNERIKMLRNGRWQMMAEPINYDRPVAGIGPGASFAAAWCSRYENDQIGLIPCAEGGSSLDEWAVGKELFQHAVMEAEMARRNSTLKGILWHQGENESSEGRYQNYAAKFSVIVEGLRRELHDPNLPVMIGGLGEYLSQGKYGGYFSEFDMVNRELEHFTENHQNCYFVTAAGLTANPDGIHIDARSQRLFGLRYFTAYDQQKNITQPLAEEAGRWEEIENRLLSETEKRFLLDTAFYRGDLSLENYEAELSSIK